MRGGVGGLGIVGESTRVHNLSSIRNHKQATHGHENIIYVCVWEALPHSHMYFVYTARGVSVELERVHKTTAQWKKNCNFLLAFSAFFFIHYLYAEECPPSDANVEFKRIMNHIEKNDKFRVSCMWICGYFIHLFRSLLLLAAITLDGSIFS